MVLIGSFFATGLLASLIHAAPSSNLAKRDDFQPGKTDYTVEQIQNTFMKSKDVITDSCVFYVGAFKSDALAWAAATSKQTLYSKYIDDTNSDRYPFGQGKDPRKSYEESNPNRLRDWWSITSRAYADLCHGTVYFMWDEKTPFSTAGVQTIWLTDELPQMRSKNQITAVKIVVPDSSTPASNWVVKDYPNWQDKTKDDPSSSNNPSNIDTPSKRSAVVLPVGWAKRLLRRASQPQMPVPETDPNVSGTLFARADDGWILGSCNIYLNQLPNEVDQGTYSLDINLYDGGVYQLINEAKYTAQAGIPLNQPSRLPYNVTVNVGSGRNDPLSFAYGKTGEQQWKSDNSSICQTGDYDGNNGRNISCFFSC